MGILLSVLLVAFAHGETVLEGSWTRVVDGCSELPAAEIERLPATGGGNQNSRAEVLDFHDNLFRARLMQPERCKDGYEPTGVAIDEADRDCRTGVNTGPLEIKDDTHFHIQSDQAGFANPWGGYFQDFEFKLFGEGTVLMVHPTTPDTACLAKDKRIYFIRTPTS